MSAIEGKHVRSRTPNDLPALEFEHEYPLGRRAHGSG